MCEKELPPGANETDRKLASLVGTDTGEYLEAVRLGLSYPEAGVPYFKRLSRMFNWNSDTGDISNDITRHRYMGRARRIIRGCG